MKKKLADKAVQVICTRGRTVATLFLTTTLIQNVSLLTEVNRLRALVGEEPLPVFEP